MKISIIDENLDFLTKIWIFDENFNFLTKIWIFDEIFTFRAKFRLLPVVSYHEASMLQSGMYNSSSHEFLSKLRRNLAK